MKRVGQRLPVAPKLFWSALRREVRFFFDARLAECEGGGAATETLVQEFEVSLRALVDEYRSKYQQAATRLPIKAERKELIAACRVLGIDPPRRGNFIDMDKAKRIKRKLVREYHPDRNGGSEATRAQYEEVLRAWEIIEQYDKQTEDEVIAQPQGADQ